jgi:hypothetical protein
MGRNIPAWILSRVKIYFKKFCRGISAACPAKARTKTNVV